jgi:hypothetical protein
VPLFFEKTTRRRIRSDRNSNFLRQIFRGVLQLAFLAFLLFVLWHGTRLKIFTINDVVIDGGETISHEDIRAKVETELQGSYFLIVPKRFTFMYPHDRIVEVLEKTPRIYGMDVARVSRTSLSVSFKEYTPHALWCMKDHPETPCYFLNAEGYAYAEAPLLQGGTLVRHNILAVEEIKAGTVLEHSVLAAIDAFIERTNNEIGMRISSLLHKSDGDIEMYVNGGGTILTTKNDLTTSFENLKSVLGSEEFKHIRPGNFNYIDVRFGNKVFVNEELGTTTEHVAE